LSAGTVYDIMPGKIIWGKMIREKSGLLHDCFEYDFFMVEIDPLYGFW